MGTVVHIGDVHFIVPLLLIFAAPRRRPSNDGIHVVALIGKHNEARSTWNPIVRENSEVALAVVSLNEIIVIFIFCVFVE
jgi:hypothetical protein